MRTEDAIYCNCCGRELDPRKAVWLELSFETGRWYPEAKCPPDESQGHFPFGVACARSVMRNQK
jgi:hypothetical protein